jgi:hypothetical protein
MPIPINGQIMANKIPKINIKMKVIMGINLTPLKKPRIDGSLIFLNLLYRKATTPPTIIPPKTLVFKD